MDIFERAIPRGDFYKKDKVIKKIEDYYGFTKKEIEKMLRLVELIPKKKSLLLAQNELNDRNVKAVMENFKVLDISPVTISKRHDVKHLKSLYSFL